MDNSGHWYDLTGQLVDVKDVRKARTLNAVPSVSTIERLLDNYVLGVWKIENALRYAFDNPPAEGEDKEDYVGRVYENSRELSLSAANLGTEVHDMLEKYLMFQDDDVARSNEAVAVVKAVKDWINDNVVEIIHSEKSAIGYVLKLAYGGTVDLVYRDKKGHVCVLDFKTQGKPKDKMNKYESWSRQVAAYGRMFPDLEVKHHQNLIISTTNPGDILFHQWSNDKIRKAWKEFKALRKLFHAMKGV